MRTDSLRKLVLVAALGLTLGLVPAAIDTDPATAFEYFDECPALECSYSPLPTAGVCEGPSGFLVVKRDRWSGLCYQSI
ncbi:MAG: hypothetical protein AAGC60_18220 [Acidobacteriota bacterium]